MSGAGAAGALLAIALATEPGARVVPVPSGLSPGSLIPLLRDRAGLETGEPLTVADGRCVVPSRVAENLAFLLAPATEETAALLIDPGVDAPRLPPKAGFDVRVVSDVGARPIRGASVVAFSEATLRKLEGLDPGMGSRTRQDGCARAMRWDGDDLLLVRGAWGADALVLAGRTRDIVVHPAKPLTGRLVNEGEEPLASRVVRALVAVPGTDRWVPIARCRTDDDGRFRFDSLGDVARIVFDDGASPPAFFDRAGEPFTLLKVPRQAVLSLRAFRGDGRPVVGAQVALRQFSAQHPSRVIHRSTVTGIDGRADFKGLSSVLDRTIVDLVFPDGSIERRSLLEPLREHEDLGAWEVPQFTRVTGVVRNTSGSPVAGASIVESGSRRVLARSDERGSVALSLLEGREQNVDIEAPGLLTTAATLSPERPFRVVLSEAARVKARVRRQDMSVPAEVRLVEVKGVIEGAVSRADRAGEDVFTFEVRPTDSALRLDAEGAEPVELGVLGLSAGEMVDLGLIVPANGGVVSGRVLDDVTGLPLAGVVVTAQAVGENELYDLVRERLPGAISDPTGRYRVAGLAEGKVRLFMESPGRPVVRVDADALSDGIDAGDTYLGMGRSLELKVLRVDGSPLANASLSLRPGGFDGLLKEIRLITDGSGSSRVERIAPGVYGMVAEAAGRQFRTLRTVTDSDSAVEWRIDAAIVRGTVRGADGQPMASVRVDLGSSGGRRYTLLELTRVSADGVPLGREQRGDLPVWDVTRTDDQGRFEFRDVPEGDMQLLASYGSTAGVWQAVTVGRKSEIVQDLVLAGRTVDVTLVGDDDGQPAEGHVLLGGAGGGELSRIDVSGSARFIFPESAGARSVSAYDRNGRSGIAWIDGSSRAVSIRVGALTGGLRLTVRDSSGQPAASATVVCLRLADDHAFTAATDYLGRWNKESLPAGRYRALVRGAGGESRRIDFSLDAGVNSVDIDLRQAGSLSVRVLTERSFDPRTTSVWIVDENGVDRASEEELLGRAARLDSHATYRMPSLEPGRYHVKVMLGNGASPAPEVAVDIEAGKLTRKELPIR